MSKTCSDCTTRLEGVGEPKLRVVVLCHTHAQVDALVEALKLATRETECLAEWLLELGHPTQDCTCDVWDHINGVLAAVHSGKEKPCS